MSLESVQQFFKEMNNGDEVIVLSKSSATVILAAKALSIEPQLIAKTLLCHTKEEIVLIVMEGTAKLDNQKFKKQFQTKAKMVSLDVVEEITGHPVGGVCPFGLKNPLKVYVDESLKKYEFVYPAAGAINAAIKLTPTYLQEITNGIWVDVCQNERVSSI